MDDEVKRNAGAQRLTRRNEGIRESDIVECPQSKAVFYNFLLFVFGTEKRVLLMRDTYTEDIYILQQT